MGVELRWNKPPKQIINGIVGNRDVLVFAAASWHRLYDQWVPMERGILAHDNVRYDAKDGAGIIEHYAPYAHRLYNGNGFNFRKEPHGLATHHWDKAAIQAGKGKALAADIQAYIRRGGGG